MNRQPVSRTCFVCGRKPSIGLKMEWFNCPEEGKVKAALTIPEQFNGYPGFVHGGIIAAILDETSGRADNDQWRARPPVCDRQPGG